MNLPTAQPLKGSSIRVRTWIALLMFVVAGLLPVIATLLDDPYLVVISTRILAFAIAAMALDLILGYGAMVSFGHAAYIGFGAYSVGILSSLGIQDLFVHMLVAILISSLFALVTGGISLRTQGIYFIMITLAFGQMAYFFFVSLSAFGGDDGMTLAERSTVLGTSSLENDQVLYYLALGLLIMLYLLCSRVVASRFGRVLYGTRENRVRMEAIGFKPFRYQLLAYVLSACITSLAGVILANQAEFISPSFMSWHVSGELIVMVVLGGIGNLVGAMGGAFAALLLEEFLSAFTEHWKLFFGIVLVLVVLYSPSGISGLLKRLAGKPA